MEIRSVPTASSVNPIELDFPRSTRHVKTLVVATSSKPSEFSFELSLTAGEVYELDSEPMSDSLKVAAMQNGSLPTEWLVCVTAAGKRRLIKKGLVERVEETQARMIQLKKASEVLVDALFYKYNTTETAAQIYVLIGTNGQLMKYFADQLIEAMQNSDCQRRRAMAAVVLNHYMTENKDFIGFVESRVDDFVKFVNEIQSDQNCPPKVVDYVCTLLSDWCSHFDSHKGELAQLLNDLTADRNFKKKLLEIVQNPSFFDTPEKCFKLKEAIQRVARTYLKNLEKTSQIVALLMSRMEESVQSGDNATLSAVFSLTGFLIPCSREIEREVMQSDRVKQIYLSYLVDKDMDREYHQWFLLEDHTEAAPPPIDRPIDRVGHLKTRPPVPPKPSKVQPKRRTVNEVKKKGERVSDPLHRFSLDSKVILGVMEQYLPKILESDIRSIKYLADGAFGYTELVEVKKFGLPVVAKMMKNGRNVSTEVLREQANLLKCIHNPHIVSIHGRIVNSESANIGILMEYMELGSLADLIHGKSQDYSEKQVFLWMSHVSNALLSLHSLNLIHRDIKPANMLLTSKGGQNLLKLGDFGMLKAINRDQNNGASKSVFGTYGYNAPETWFLSDSTYSTGVDIYAFAVTIWEICQRRRPHLIENLESYDGSLKKTSLRPKLENPRHHWMPKLVTKMWQTDPSLRPTITEVDEEIKTLLDL